MFDETINYYNKNAKEFEVGRGTQIAMLPQSIVILVGV